MGHPVMVWGLMECSLGQLPGREIWQDYNLVAQMVKNLLQCRRPGFDPRVGKIPWRRVWQLTPVFLPGESHRQRSQVGHSPWGHKETDTTEQLTLPLFFFSSQVVMNLIVHAYFQRLKVSPIACKVYFFKIRFYPQSMFSGFLIVAKNLNSPFAVVV